MFDDCYFDYNYRSKLDNKKSKVISQVELTINDNYDYFYERVGTVFKEERTWNDFLLSEYNCSDGTAVKNSELSDGKRVAELYDFVTGEYECNVFDNQGTLLIKDKSDRNGNYEIEERMPDGTISTQTGTSIFIRCIDGKII